MPVQNNAIIDTLVSLMLSTNDRERKCLKEKLRRLAENRPNTESVTKREITERVLTDIGVPRSLAGFRYCTDAILFINKEGFPCVTKHTYKHVAEMYSTTVPAVERCVRLAAELTTINCPRDLYFTIFGNTIPASTGKPTNKAFLHGVAHYVKTLTEEMI